MSSGSMLPVRGMVLLAALAAAAPAWSLYQIKDDKGNVIGYSDKPPAGGKSVPVNLRGGAESPSVGSGLPYELQQIASRFPVTLYSSKSCGPCDAGRSYLKRRGIPFAERTVDTPADSVAFQNLEGTAELPVLRIGGQRINGYSAENWGGYLDTAGYPKESRLPSSYQAPSPAPLAPAPAAAPAAAPSPAPSPAPAAAPAGNAPPGFQF